MNVSLTDKPQVMDSKNKYIPAFRFHFLTKWFDLFLATTFPEIKVKQALIDQCDFGPGKMNVLDFGCGTLTLSIMAFEQFPFLEITALDVDSKVLEIARQKLTKKGLKIQLDKYDGVLFPYADNYFDVVYTSLVFHHLEDQNKIFALKEILRVLKPGGKFCIADFGVPKGFFRKISFAFIRRLDGEKYTRSNAKGLLFLFIHDTGFKNVKEIKEINLVFGTISIIEGYKAGLRKV